MVLKHGNLPYAAASGRCDKLTDHMFRRGIDIFMNQESFSYFVNLAHTLLQVDLVHLDGKKLPTTELNRQLVPHAVCASYDDLFFGDTLLSFMPGRLKGVNERFHTHYSVLRLQNDEGWLLLGPYLPEEPIEFNLDKILLDNDLLLSFRQEYDGFYQRLPVLAYYKVYNLLSCISYTLFRQTVDEANYESIDLSDYPAKYTTFDDETLHPYAETIRVRYENERFILQCVARGDFAAIESMVTNMPILSRLSNQLRNDKNLLITFNTLLRKAIESAHVHPIYIDRISTRFVVRIEQLRSSDSIPAFRREMAREYCEVVKRYSLADYSPTIRRILEYIHFNLSSKLTLTVLADKYKLNPNYLSTQFNREVKQSLPEYITNYRISESCRLMQNTDATINQIATAVGIYDPNYFSRIFKKTTGISPSQYRHLLDESHDLNLFP